MGSVLVVSQKLSIHLVSAEPQILYDTTSSLYGRITPDSTSDSKQNLPLYPRYVQNVYVASVHSLQSHRPHFSTTTVFLQKQDLP